MLPARDTTFLTRRALRFQRSIRAVWTPVTVYWYIKKMDGARGRTKIAWSNFEHLRFVQMARRANYMEVIRNLTGVPVRGRNKLRFSRDWYIKKMDGARGRNRTGTVFPPRDFLTNYSFRCALLKTLCGLDFLFTISWSNFMTQAGAVKSLHFPDNNNNKKPGAGNWFPGY